NPSGWFVDAVATKTIAAGTDYTLLVALDSAPDAAGTLPTVNVVLNGSSVLSMTYNVQFVGGVNQGDIQLGLLARYGTASFYGVPIKGDARAYPGGGTPQLAIDAPPNLQPMAPLTGAQLAPIVTAAIERWATSPALHRDVSALRQATVTIATLPDLMV